MGRPLYKDRFGTDARGSYTTTALGIRCTAYFGGSLHDDCFIVNQKGGRKYKVQDTSDSTVGFCKLVNGAPSANGQMRLVGLLDGKTGQQVTLNKLMKRTAVDWSGNRYTWRLANDSSNDAIILTAI